MAEANGSKGSGVRQEIGEPVTVVAGKTRGPQGRLTYNWAARLPAGLYLELILSLPMRAELDGLFLFELETYGAKRR